MANQSGLIFDRKWSETDHSLEAIMENNAHFPYLIKISQGYCQEDVGEGLTVSKDEVYEVTGIETRQTVQVTTNDGAVYTIDESDDRLYHVITKSGTQGPMALRDILRHFGHKVQKIILKPEYAATPNRERSKTGSLPRSMRATELRILKRDNKKYLLVKLILEDDTYMTFWHESTMMPLGVGIRALTEIHNEPTHQPEANNSQFFQAFGLEKKRKTSFLSKLTRPKKKKTQNVLPKKTPSTITRIDETSESNHATAAVGGSSQDTTTQSHDTQDPTTEPRDAQDLTTEPRDKQELTTEQPDTQHITTKLNVPGPPPLFLIKSEYVNTAQRSPPGGISIGVIGHNIHHNETPQFGQVENLLQAANTYTTQEDRPTEVHRPASTYTTQEDRLTEVHIPANTYTTQEDRPTEVHRPASTYTSPEDRPTEVHRPVAIYQNTSPLTNIASIPPKSSKPYCTVKPIVHTPLHRDEYITLPHNASAANGSDAQTRNNAMAHYNRGGAHHLAPPEDRGVISRAHVNTHPPEHVQSVPQIDDQYITLNHSHNIRRYQHVYVNQMRYTRLPFPLHHGVYVQLDVGFGELNEQNRAPHHGPCTQHAPAQERCDHGVYLTIKRPRETRPWSVGSEDNQEGLIILPSDMEMPSRNNIHRYITDQPWHITEQPWHMTDQPPTPHLFLAPTADRTANDRESSTTHSTNAARTATNCRSNSGLNLVTHETNTRTLATSIANEQRITNGSTSKNRRNPATTDKGNVHVAQSSESSVELPATSYDMLNWKTFSECESSVGVKKHTDDSASSSVTHSPRTSEADGAMGSMDTHMRHALSAVGLSDIAAHHKPPNFDVTSVDASDVAIGGATSSGLNYCIHNSSDSFEKLFPQTNADVPALADDSLTKGSSASTSQTSSGCDTSLFSKNDSSFTHLSSVPPGVDVRRFAQPSSCIPGLDDRGLAERVSISLHISSSTSSLQGLSIVDPSSSSSDGAVKFTQSHAHDTCQSLSDVRSIDTLSMEDIARCLRLLNMPHHVDTFSLKQIDGHLAQSLTIDMLVEDLKFTKFEAMKFMQFANGWRPKKT